MSSDRFTDCVRLGDTERQRLFDALEHATADPDTHSKRIFERTAFYGHEIPLICFDGDHRESGRFIVLSRNLSASGISLLHGGFVYANSRCEVILKTLDSEFLRAKGTVMHCRLVKGRVHEIGVRFDKLIDPESFIEELFSEPLRSPKNLAGLVVTLEPSDAGFQELSDLTSGIGLTLNRSKSAQGVPEHSQGQHAQSRVVQPRL